MPFGFSVASVGGFNDGFRRLSKYSAYSRGHMIEVGGRLEASRASRVLQFLWRASDLFFCDPCTPEMGVWQKECNLTFASRTIGAVRGGKMSSGSRAIRASVQGRC